MPASSRRRALLLICAVAVAVATNYTIQGPVLGFIRAEFALSSANAGTIATAFFVGSAITMLAGGAIADRIGTRPAVTLGFLLVAIGNLGIGLLAPSFPALLGWRVLGGLGSGFGFAAGASYTRSIFDDRGRHLAQGLYGASFLWARRSPWPTSRSWPDPPATGGSPSRSPASPWPWSGSCGRSSPPALSLIHISEPTR